MNFLGAYTGSYECINQGRFYELPFLEHVRSLGLRGTYLDIGTNIGNHAIYFANFCPSDKVVGFEPVDRWRERARQNADANGCGEKIQIHPFGLLDKSGAHVFPGKKGVRHEIQCSTLDEALADVGGVTFVKMDVEGAEPRVLLGGREFLARNRPVIYAEVLGDSDELAAAAGAIGYALTGWQLRSSHLHELAPLSG